MTLIKTGFIKINARTNKHYTILKLISIGDNLKREIQIQVQEDDDDVCQCWRGNFDSRSISKWAKETNLTVQQYVDETVAALTDSKSTNHYVIELQPLSADTAELRWKKQLTADSINFKLGCVELRSTPSNSGLLKDCIESIKSLEEELTQVKKLREALETENCKLTKRLNECCTAKQQLEIDLYSKFVKVINEKKERIKQLEMSKLKQPLTMVNPVGSGNVVVKKEKKSANVVVKKEKESEDQFLLDLNESQELDLISTCPSTSRKRTIKTQGTSLFTPKVVVRESSLSPTDDAETIPFETEEILADFD